MNNLLKKIYNNVLVYESDVIKVNEVVDNEIHIFLEQYKDKLSANEVEELKNMLSSIALVAEQVGFEVGVKFMIKLLCVLRDD